MDHSFCGFNKAQPSLHPRNNSIITSAATNPVALYANESFSLEIGINKREVAEMKLKNNFIFKDQLRRNGMPIDSFVLKDDGTQGDAKAGDLVFTINDIKISVGSFFDILPDVISYSDIRLIYKNGATESFTRVPIFIAYRLKPYRFFTPTVKIINENVQHTDYVINVVTKQNVNAKEIAKLYYTHLADDRDFLVHATTYPTDEVWANTAGTYASVSNSVKGLQGKSVNSIIDFSGEYGSKGRLQGFIDTYLGRSFENWLITHELTHRWALYTDPSLSWDLGSHWGGVFLGTTGFGWNKVNQITKRSDSSIIVNYGISQNFFNKVELYLMGLIPIDSLDFPYTVYENATYLGDLPEGSLIQFSKSKTVSRADFLRVMDLRTPGLATSQKEFKLGFIVTSPRLLTARELAYFDNKAREYELDALPAELNACLNPSRPDCGNNTFNIAAQGKAKLSTRIASLPVTTSITSASQSAFKVFPNPSAGTLYISSSDEKKGSVQYQVMDMSGRLLKNGFVTNNTIRLPTSKGLVILKLNHQNHVQIQKIVVQ
jgi:hypothetical protein